MYYGFQVCSKDFQAAGFFFRVVFFLAVSSTKIPSIVGSRLTRTCFPFMKTHLYFFFRSFWLTFLRQLVSAFVPNQSSPFEASLFRIANQQASQRRCKILQSIVIWQRYCQLLSSSLIRLNAVGKTLTDLFNHLLVRLGG